MSDRALTLVFTLVACAAWISVVLFVLEGLPRLLWWAGNKMEETHELYKYRRNE